MKSIDFSGKRVFVRADLNVPIQSGEILCDFRLSSVLPTIDHIISVGGKIILATHIGRPKPGEIDKSLSTKIIFDWFKEKGYSVSYLGLLQDLKNSTKSFSSMKFDIIVFENLRFLIGEKSENLKESEELTSDLSECFDFFVNDAFGLIHRNDTSITILPEKFDQNHKCLGLLAEKEIEQISKIKKTSQSPFVLILGGKKAGTKLQLLEKIIKNSEVNLDAIILGGKVANEFLKNISQTDEKVDTKSILEEIAKSKVELLLPKDLIVKPVGADKALIICASDFVPDRCEIVDIGPKSTAIFAEKISSAQTIFVNGSMGIHEKEESSGGTRKILEAAANSNAYKVVSGGDTVGAVFKFKLSEKIDFLSTGGGATLAFLASKNPQDELSGLKSIFN